MAGNCQQKGLASAEGCQLLGLIQRQAVPLMALSSRLLPPSLFPSQPSLMATQLFSHSSPQIYSLSQLTAASRA